MGGTGLGRDGLFAILELTDTVAADFDIKRFAGRLAERGAELPGVAAAGVLIADPDGGPAVTAATAPRALMLGEYEFQRGEGPGLDAYRTGRYVRQPDLGVPDPRWPRFGAAAGAAGFAAVHALPLARHLTAGTRTTAPGAADREVTLGALTLFGTEAGTLPGDVLAAGRALAGAAGIGLAHRRRLDQVERLAGQLSTALDTRIVIEQAKGLLAERRQIDVGAAFEVLRTYARAHRTKLGEIAARVVDGTLDPDPRGTR